MVLRLESRRTLRSKISIGEYLAFLSTKYEMDPDQFYHALVSAGKNQEIICGELSIRCRSRDQNRTIILIVKGSKVVAQFPISEDFLQEPKNPIRNFMRVGLAGRCLIKKKASSQSLCIRDLRNGMKQISLKAKILAIPEPRLVYTRFGNYASVANALVTDETGTIKLCLWNEQISSVSIGDTVQIENANVSTFRGESQLRIGRKGKLSKVTQLSLQPQIHA